MQRVKIDFSEFHTSFFDKAKQLSFYEDAPGRVKNSAFKLYVENSEQNSQLSLHPLDRMVWKQLGQELTIDIPGLPEAQKRVLSYVLRTSPWEFDCYTFTLLLKFADTLLPLFEANQLTVKAFHEIRMKSGGFSTGTENYALKGILTESITGSSLRHCVAEGAERFCVHSFTVLPAHLATPPCVLHKRGMYAIEVVALPQVPLNYEFVRVSEIDDHKSIDHAAQMASGMVFA